MANEVAIALEVGSTQCAYERSLLRMNTIVIVENGFGRKLLLTCFTGVLPLQMLHRYVLAQFVLAVVRLITMRTLECLSRMATLVDPERAPIGKGSRTISTLIIFNIQVNS